MQNYGQVPIPVDVADWFAYPALSNSTGVETEEIQIATAGGNAKAYVTLQSQHYFAFCGFACKTNYDNFGGIFASASAVAIIAQPNYPNNFELEIQRSSDNNYANTRLTQAEIGSSGLLSGKQNPYPVIYDGSITISFNLFDISGLGRLTQADASVPLNIQLWMIGYSIPESMGGARDANLMRFLNYFPALKRATVP